MGRRKLARSSNTTMVFIGPPSLGPPGILDCSGIGGSSGVAADQEQREVVGGLFRAGPFENAPDSPGQDAIQGCIGVRAGGDNARGAEGLPGGVPLVRRPVGIHEEPIALAQGEVYLLELRVGV